MPIPTVTEAVSALIAEAMECKLVLDISVCEDVIPLSEVKSLNFYDGKCDTKDTNLDA